MKKFAAVIVCVLFNGFIGISQKNEWRDRPEIKVFLLKIDSVLEVKFGHPMEPFAEFEAGALNYVKNEAGLHGGTDEYIYNEAYAHFCAFLPIPFNEMPQSFFLEDAAEKKDNAKINSFMELLDPDKYWVSYYEIEGNYYYVLCLGVDREKTYREMGFGSNPK
jgi:hypothetical protein